MEILFFISYKMSLWSAEEFRIMNDRFYTDIFVRIIRPDIDLLLSCLETTKTNHNDR